MIKNKAPVVIILIIAAILLFSAPRAPNFPKGLFSAVSISKTFIWNNMTVKVSSSAEKSTSCSSWGGNVEPSDNSNAALHLEAYSSFGKCSGSGAGASAQIIVPNPKLYKSIFIPTSGQTQTGYGGTQSCPSASIGGNLMQTGGKSINLIDISAGCVGTDKSVSSGILLNIEGDFIIIPAAQNVMQLIGDGDLIFDFGVGANGNTNGRSGKASLTISPFQFTLKEILCPPSYTPVCSTDNLTFVNLCSLNKASKQFQYSGECSVQKIMLKPTCSDCPSDTSCVENSNASVACVRTEIKNETIVKEIVKTIIVEQPKPKFTFDSLPASAKVVAVIIFIFIISRL